LEIDWNSLSSSDGDQDSHNDESGVVMSHADFLAQRSSTGMRCTSAFPSETMNANFLFLSDLSSIRRVLSDAKRIETDVQLSANRGTERDRSVF
jgi:hypothetical protein